MKKLLILLFSLVLGPLAFAVPNPASVYCQDMGYIIDNENCIFTDGTYCEQWAFYNGECGEEYVKEVCKKAGESSYVTDCCEGMDKISPTAIYDNNCNVLEITGFTSICSDCGNNICETWENKCNCPEDCKTIIGYPQITDQTCDACDNQCPEGLVCINFPGIGKRCAKSDPCSYYKCPSDTKCEVLQTEMARICPGSAQSVGDIPRLTCKCTGLACPVSSNAENVVSYDSVTKTVVYTVYQNEQPVSHNISLWKTTSGNMGILQTVTATVGYTGKLAVEENGLFMETSDGKKPINIMPEAAVAVSETPTSVTKVELKEESQQPVYSVTGTQPARILFIIPVDLEIETKISAVSGDVISINKPWWSFLAW